MKKKASSGSLQINFGQYKLCCVQSSRTELEVLEEKHH